MTRAATAPELVKFASNGQYSNVYGFISSPATVFACRVNEASPSNDNRIAISYDGVTTGAYTDILAGETVLIGSAAGLSDKGIGCVSDGSTSTEIAILRTSDLAIADNDYVTVLRDFAIWPKVDLPTYTDQLTTRKPTVVMGGDRALYLSGASVSTAYALTGAASYVTTCSGGTVTNGTTNAPSIAFTSAGEYLVKVVATGANGAVSTTYRTVYVWSDADRPKNIILTQNGADEAGWSASIDLYESQSAVRDRAKVVIFAQDYYGGVEGSIGSVTGCENVITAGWINGKSITQDADGGSISFDVEGAGWWLDQCGLPDESLMIGDATGANWHHMASLTPDLFAWFILEWHSTALNCADAVFTGDTRTGVKMTASPGSVWSQVGEALGRIGAAAFCNQYGQIVCSIDTPLIPIADRSSIPVVVTLTSDDFEEIGIDAQIVQSTSQVILTSELSNGVVICSLAPGHQPARLGSVNALEGWLATDQPTANVTAGAIYARDNAPYSFTIRNLRSNNRLIEPGNRLGLTLTGSDNLGGLSYSGYIIVRSVDRSHDPETGAWTIDLDADTETQAVLYCTGEVPVEDEFGQTNGVPFGSFPNFKFGSFPPTPPAPPVIQPSATTCLDDAPANGPFLSGWDKTFVDGTPSDSAYCWYPCSLRSTSATNKTVLAFYIWNKGQAYNHLKCYAVNGAKERLVTGTVSTTFLQAGMMTEMQVDFAPLTSVSVAGFELVCDEGFDLDSAGFDTVNVVNPTMAAYGGWSGTVSGTQDTAAGKLEFLFTGTKVAGGGGYDITWSFNPLPASSGNLYAYATLNTIGVPEHPFTLDFSEAGHLFVPMSGATILYSGKKLATLKNWQWKANGAAAIRVTTGYSDGGGSFSGTLKLYYSGSAPARWAGLSTLNIYNVCPAVTA